MPLAQEDQNNGHNSGHALKGGSASNTAHTYGKFHTGEAHRDSTRMLLQINNPEKSTFHFVPKAETPSGWSVLAFHIIANHFQNVCGGVCVHACRYIPTYRCALQKRVLVGLLYYFLPFPKRHGLSLSLELRWLTACKHQRSSFLHPSQHKGYRYAWPHPLVYMNTVELRLLLSTYFYPQSCVPGPLVVELRAIPLLVLADVFFLC